MLNPNTALQQNQRHSRAHEVRLCLCLVSCYKKEPVIGERERGRKRERERVVLRRGRRGRVGKHRILQFWSHYLRKARWRAQKSHRSHKPEYKGISLPHCLKPKSQLCCAWADYTDSGPTKVKYVLPCICNSCSVLHVVVLAADVFYDSSVNSFFFY